MKRRSNNPFLLSELIIGLGLMLAGRVTAQTFTTLYSFTDGSDGANPIGGLILSGNTLYGTASSAAGSSGYGTVFTINTDGTGFRSLYDFTGGSDGADPYAGLILSGNTLYGTAFGLNGGSYNGTVFAVNTDGTALMSLYSFTATEPSPTLPTNSDGANPLAGLVLSSHTLYGTARQGGSSGNGTVFSLNIDGTGFTTLHNFIATSATPPSTTATEVRRRQI